MKTCLYNYMWLCQWFHQSEHRKFKMQIWNTFLFKDLSIVLILAKTISKKTSNFVKYEPKSQMKRHHFQSKCLQYDTSKYPIPRNNLFFGKSYFISWFLLFIFYLDCFSLETLIYYKFAFFPHFTITFKG